MRELPRSFSRDGTGQDCRRPISYLISNRLPVSRKFLAGVAEVYHQASPCKMRAVAELYIGTSAFTASGWEGSFYPAGMKPADFLTYYATKFNSVEVDSTFYRTPSASTVTGWNRKTPDHFIFAVKVPETITH
jgi:hypothetical protein